MRKRYILGLVITSVILYSLLSMISDIGRLMDNQVKIEFNREEKLVTDRIAFQIEELFTNLKRDVLFLSSPFVLLKLVNAIDSGDKKEIDFWKDGVEKVYLSFMNSHPYCSYIRFIDNNGIEIIKIKDPLLQSSGDSISAMTAELDSSSISVSRVNNMIKTEAPVYYEKQKKGVVILGMTIKKVHKIISPVKYGENSHTWLITDKGKLLFCSRSLSEGHHRGEIEYILKNPVGVYTETHEGHKEEVLMASSSLAINNENWIVVIEATEEEITKRIKELETKRQRLIILLMAVSAGIAVAFHRIRSGRIAAEIKAETEEMAHRKVEEINKELDIANEKLRDMDRIKTDFMNVVAHDLRTPLTSIRSYTDMLLMYKNRPETIQKVYEEFLNIIKKESIRLGNLIDDYLDLAKIEAGHMEFKKESININDLISDSIAIYKGERYENKINLKLELSEDMPFVLGDDSKIRQVIANLISNAVKYTPGGKTITVVTLKKEGYAEVSVEDGGTGIPKEYHERIFEKFVQLKDKNGIVKKGTGLGLQITKEIINKCGGKIWVESEKGRGAKFIFTLPLK